MVKKYLVLFCTITAFFLITIISFANKRTTDIKATDNLKVYDKEDILKIINDPAPIRFDNIEDFHIFFLELYKLTYQNDIQVFNALANSNHALVLDNADIQSFKVAQLFWLVASATNFDLVSDKLIITAISSPFTKMAELTLFKKYRDKELDPKLMIQILSIKDMDLTLLKWMVQKIKINTLTKEDVDVLKKKLSLVSTLPQYKRLMSFEKKYFASLLLTIDNEIAQSVSKDSVDKGLLDINKKASPPAEVSKIEDLPKKESFNEEVVSKKKVILAPPVNIVKESIKEINSNSKEKSAVLEETTEDHFDSDLTKSNDVESGNNRETSIKVLPVSDDNLINELVEGIEDDIFKIEPITPILAKQTNSDRQYYNNISIDELKNELNVHLKWVIDDKNNMITLNDIVLFDWEKQIFRLTNAAAIRLLSKGRNWKKPLEFTLTDGNKIIYKGIFVNSSLTTPYVGPTIQVDRYKFISDAVPPPFFEIRSGYLGQFNDDEFNKRNGRILLQNSYLKYILRKSHKLGVIDTSNIKKMDIISTNISYGVQEILLAGAEVYVDSFLIGEHAKVFIDFKKGKNFSKNADHLEVLLVINEKNQRFSAQQLIKNIPLSALNTGVMCEFYNWSENRLIKNETATPGDAELNIMITLKSKENKSILFCEFPQLDLRIKKRH